MEHKSDFEKFPSDLDRLEKIKLDPVLVKESRKTLKDCVNCAELNQRYLTLQEREASFKNRYSHVESVIEGFTLELSNELKEVVKIKHSDAEAEVKDIYDTICRIEAEFEECYNPFLNPEKKWIYGDFDHLSKLLVELDKKLKNSETLLANTNTLILNMQAHQHDFTRKIYSKLQSFNNLYDKINSCPVTGLGNEYRQHCKDMTKITFIRNVPEYYQSCINEVARRSNWDTQMRKEVLRTKNSFKILFEEERTMRDSFARTHTFILTLFDSTFNCSSPSISIEYKSEDDLIPKVTTHNQNTYELTKKVDCPYIENDISYPDNMDDLKFQLKDLETIVQKQRIEIKAQDDVISSLQYSTESSSIDNPKSVLDLSEELNAKKKEVSIMQAEIVSLKDTLSAKDSMIQDFKNKVVFEENSLSSSEDIQRLQAEINALREQSKSKDNEMLVLREKFKHKENECEALKKELKQVEDLLDKAAV
eukprot:TRINITY_DN5751_c0_g2_i1.p1 TRINITY_DN5751_c0_g2~~TRINITY_DN5751_c0_g2_i1.p1  ORF type:complete len:554 (-),score=79.94 TRINITY_DN5751_c0_g2_i1:45-1478(-)